MQVTLSLHRKVREQGTDYPRCVVSGPAGGNSGPRSSRRRLVTPAGVSIPFDGSLKRRLRIYLSPEPMNPGGSFSEHREARAAAAMMRPAVAIGILAPTPFIVAAASRRPAHRILRLEGVAVSKGAWRRARARTDDPLRPGHMGPVIGPAEGRTCWLCPPYGSFQRGIAGRRDRS
jgi:hypothetical protein